MQLPLKAVIGLSGVSSRFLPATKEFPKQLFPIIDKPIVQHCVEEVVASGVEDVILVTNRDGHSLEAHFDQNKSLEEQLKEQGKDDKVKIINDLVKIARFVNVRQQPFMPYGTAVPLIISKDLVSDAPFFFLYGDDITLSDTPVCKQLLEVYKQNPDAAAVVAAQQVPTEVVDRYGIFKLKDGTDNELETLIEKPTIEEAPSNLASLGRFLFTPKIIPYVEKLKEGKNNELWLIDAVKEMAKTEKVIVHEIDGKWMTTGDPLNYLKAVVEFALVRDDLKDDFKNYLKTKLD